MNNLKRIGFVIWPLLAVIAGICLSVLGFMKWSWAFVVTFAVVLMLLIALIMILSVIIVWLDSRNTQYKKLQESKAGKWQEGITTNETINI